MDAEPHGTSIDPKQHETNIDLDSKTSIDLEKYVTTIESVAVVESHEAAMALSSRPTSAQR
jgi:hypothetical protein